MKAMRYHSYGDSGVLVGEEVDRPATGPGQVLLRVAGTSFNMLDVALRLGILRDAISLTFPHIPNCDVSGIVVEIGDGVSGWHAGDPVIALLPPDAPGAAADYVVAPAEALAAAPRTVDLADTAALPLAGLTAWQALFEYAELRSGQSLLINGAGGGVGGYAVQLAARSGALVTATVSPRSRDRVTSYGAAQTVDHTTTPIMAAVANRRFDAVLQLVRDTPEQTALLANLVTDGGTFVSTTTPGPDHPERNIRIRQVLVRSDAAQLTDLTTRVDAGTLKIAVAQRRPLTDLPTIHDDALAGHLPGKTILIP
ncbi:NADP-dependent oxidoreductase [Nocardia blacklockiae]|uniref:NADP-dependent oxidoreductase n=1 Tax=Nocardia blacklockiae TaxID=480036 RepID=UPI001893F2D5|nr:NADP-dependent oxidoreductase [Nocardia blacklockiae]MBF6174185.1 NADP-dependent oxidoreductase [Nocardia blacklockiae]